MGKRASVCCFHPVWMQISETSLKKLHLNIKETVCYPISWSTATAVNIYHCSNDAHCVKASKTHVSTVIHQRPGPIYFCLQTSKWTLRHATFHCLTILKPDLVYFAVFLTMQRKPCIIYLGRFLKTSSTWMRRVDANFIIPPTHSLSAGFYPEGFVSTFFPRFTAPPPHFFFPYIRTALFFQGPVSSRNKGSEWVRERDWWRVETNEDRGREKIWG